MRCVVLIVNIVLHCIHTLIIHTEPQGGDPIRDVFLYPLTFLGARIEPPSPLDYSALIYTNNIHSFLLQAALSDPSQTGEESQGFNPDQPHPTWAW